MHDIHRFPLQYYSSAVLRDFRRASAERVAERNLRALPIVTVIGENSLDFIPWWCTTLSQGFSYSLDGSSDSILPLNLDTLRLVQFIPLLLPLRTIVLVFGNFKAKYARNDFPHASSAGNLAIVSQTIGVLSYEAFRF